MVSPTQEVAAGNTEHLLWFLANYPANCLGWQRGHWECSGPDHFDKVGFIYLESAFLLPSYFFVV